MEEVINKSKEYFFLQYNQKVELPDYRNFLGYVSLENKEHKVFISNRDLKKFIESRKESFTKNNNEEYALNKILQMWNVFEVIVNNFDSYKFLESGRLEIKKDLRYLRMRSLRLVIDIDKEKSELEVVTYHPFS